MAASRVVSSAVSGQFTDNGTLTCPVNPTVGNSIIITAISFKGSGPATPTISKSSGTATIGTPVTDGTHPATGSLSGILQLDIIRVPITGSGSLVIGFTSSVGTLITIGLEEITGVDSTPTLDGTPVVNDGVAQVYTSGNVPTTVAGIAIALYADDSSGPTYSNYSDNVVWGQPNSASVTGTAQDKVISGSGTSVLTVDGGASFGFTVLVVVYKASTGGGGTPIPGEMIQNHFQPGQGELGIERVQNFFKPQQGILPQGHKQFNLPSSFIEDTTVLGTARQPSFFKAQPGGAGLNLAGKRNNLPASIPQQDDGFDSYGNSVVIGAASPGILSQTIPPIRFISPPYLQEEDFGWFNTSKSNVPDLGVRNIALQGKFTYSPLPQEVPFEFIGRVNTTATKSGAQIGLPKRIIQILSSVAAIVQNEINNFESLYGGKQGHPSHGGAGPLPPPPSILPPGGFVGVGVPFS